MPKLDYYYTKLENTRQEVGVGLEGRREKREEGRRFVEFYFF